MHVRALLPLCLLLGACAAETGDRGGEGSTTSRIVGGTPSTSAQDATVYIAIGTKGEFCSGALIAPNLVLTARHCVQGTDETSTLECTPYTTMNVPSTLTISLGTNAAPTAVAAIGKQTFVDGGTDLCSHDLALILLDRDVAGAKIATVRFSQVAKGETSTTVGYGDDGSGTPTNGRYERAALNIDAVGPAASTYTTKANQAIPFTVHGGEVATGESTCFGDSGGPLFDSKARIIGVTSRGLDQECIDRPSIYSDTASHAKMIRDAAITAGHPLADAPDDGPAAGDLTGAGDEGDPNASDGTDDPTTKTSPKRGSALTPQANAGCATARSGTRENGAKWPLSTMFVVAMLALRRRRATRAILDGGCLGGQNTRSSSR